VNWLIIGVSFIAFWLLRALYYFLRLKEIIKLKDVYHNYLHNNNYDFAQSKPRIIELFKLADLRDFNVLHIEHISYTQGLRTNLSGFANITSNREDVVTSIKIKFEEAIGTFRQRMKQSFSPFFWIEFILNFPQKLLAYLNISAPDSMLKIIQLIYWLFMILIGLHSSQLIDLRNIF